MGEDFEVDICPKCGSNEVEVEYNPVTQVRIRLNCKNCRYLEIVEESPELEEPSNDQEDEPWKIDPDFWKD